jgi:biotin operon repressor
MKAHDRRFEFLVRRGGERRREEFVLSNAIIAGWTGRERAAIEKHIDELQKLGVPRPASTPIYYRIATSRITTSAGVEVSGEHSSGEVEFVLIRHGGRLYVGVGSDHTDRAVETYNVTVSKQMCEKPIAPEVWLYDDVEKHWDELVLRSWVHDGHAVTLYQEGPVSEMLAPARLIAGSGDLPDGTLMLCGTLATRGGIRAADRFEIEIADPCRGQAIRHAYDIRILPNLG